MMNIMKYKLHCITQNILDNGRRLRVCALRPNGIYGENEKRHLPRVMDNIEGGYTIFKFGVGEPAYIDWVHVDNLVQVHTIEY